MGKIMEKFTDSVARKIWNQMEEEQRNVRRVKFRQLQKNKLKNLESLYETEHSDNTIQRYCQEVRKFMEFLDGRVPENNFSWNIGTWKRNKYNVRSVNVKISAINAYFVWSKRPELKMHFLKIQKKSIYLREKATIFGRIFKTSYSGTEKE